MKSEQRVEILIVVLGLKAPGPPCLRAADDDLFVHAGRRGFSRSEVISRRHQAFEQGHEQFSGAFRSERVFDHQLLGESLSMWVAVI